MSRYPEYADSLDSWWWPQGMVLVRICTDSGICGIGWAEDGTAAATAIIANHLKKFLIGQNPANIDVLWDQMYRASIPLGRGGVFMHALSAVDIALWDLNGKATDRPVHDLLGGAKRQSMEAYASHLQPVPLDQFKEEALGYLAEGYQSMKMRMPGGPQHGDRGIVMNLERMQIVRDAIGPEHGMMADAYMGWDLRFAQRMLDAAADMSLGWIEEPLLPDERHAYQRLCAHSSTPIAHGENSFSPWEFTHMIEDKAVQVVQPDVHRVGGITGFRRVAQTAELHGIEVVPHAFSAPTVSICSTLGNCRLLEVLTIPCWAKDAYEDTPSLILDQPFVEKGTVAISQKPGLGIRINTDLAPQLNGWND